MKGKKALIAILTTAMLLVSCGPDASKESAEESKTSESTQNTESQKMESSEAESSETAPEEVTPKDPYVTKENDSKKYPPRITLSGNHDDHVITDQLCYVEGEKYFLLLDKDVDLPGDFGDNVELIIDEIEKVTGLTFHVPKPLYACDNSTVLFGYDPWAGFDFGMKVPIYVYPDREDKGYISGASAEFVNLQMYELYGMDLWNSVPSYRDNSWRRGDYVLYEMVAHELTHVLTCRRAALTKIMTEGSADYVAEKVIKNLASATGQYDFVESEAHMFFFNHVKAKVTAENAEALFRNDYAELSSIDRGDEYSLGRMLCLFLEENYGEFALRDYITAAINAGYGYPEFIGDPTREDIDKLADVFKATFGDDVFEKFGAWYQTHKDK